MHSLKADYSNSSNPHQGFSMYCYPKRIQSTGCVYVQCCVRYRDWPGSCAGRTAAEEPPLWMSGPPWSRTRSKTSEPDPAESTVVALFLTWECLPQCAHGVCVCGHICWGGWTQGSKYKAFWWESSACLPWVCLHHHAGQLIHTCVLFVVFVLLGWFILLANKRKG